MPIGCSINGFRAVEPMLQAFEWVSEWKTRKNDFLTHKSHEWRTLSRFQFNTMDSLLDLSQSVVQSMDHFSTPRCTVNCRVVTNDKALGPQRDGTLSYNSCSWCHVIIELLPTKALGPQHEDVMSSFNYCSWCCVIIESLPTKALWPSTRCNIVIQ
jgi:hypothetical protein